MASIRDLLDDGTRYVRSGALEKALRCFDAALEAAVADADRSSVLRHQADVYRTQCEWNRAFAAARQSAELAKGAGRDDLLAEAVNAEAAIHLSLGHLPEARAMYERMLEIAKDERIRGVGLQNLGSIAARSGDLEAAEERFRQSHLCFQRAGYARGEAIALSNSAAIALDCEKYEAAELTGIEAIAAAQRVEDLELVGIARLNYAEALAKLGRLSEAEEHVSAALGFFGVTPNLWRQVECLLLLGEIHEELDDIETARRVYERGLHLATQIDAQADASKLEARLEALGVN